MSFESKGKFFKYAAGANMQQRLDADAVERNRVLAELKSCLAKYPAEQKILGWDYQIELQKNSSLHEIHAPGQMLLIKLTRTTAMRSYLLSLTLDDRPPICVAQSGKMEVFAPDGWIDFKDHYNHKGLNFDHSVLSLITDIAKETGGYVWTDDEITVDQWLSFHGYDVPGTAAQLTNLIAYFEFEFPEVDDLGNYGGQLVVDDQSFITLSSEQCLAIKNVTSQQLPSQSRLLDSLMSGSRPGIAVHDNAAVMLKQVIAHSVSQGWARSCLQRLHWLGSQAGQTISESQLGQLLVTAMLLDINPFIGKQQNRKSVGSYELYSPRYLGRPASVVLEGLRDHMVANQWVGHDAAPLAIHLCLAQIAPEFIVRQVPTSIAIGSLEWVAFCRGVALVEAAVQGAARVMTYPQIMAYAQLEPVSQSLADVHMLALIDPIVDWALINAVVTEAELKQDEKATTQRAIVAYQQYVANFSQVGIAYSTPLPDRRAIARAVLEAAAPGCDFLEKPRLNQRPGLWTSPTTVSMVDLHMSGDLTKQEWDFHPVFPDSKAPDLQSQITGSRPATHDPSVVSIYRRYPKLLQLADNNVEFSRQLRSYLGEMNVALATTLKLALSRMSYFDLQDVLRGELTFFTVRDSAVITRTTPIGGPLHRKEPVESQAGKDAATGRFGLVMCASHRGKTSCFEVFTLRGEIHRNDELGKLIVSGGKLQAPARVDFKGDLKTHVAPTPKQRLPINIKCYIEGVANDFKVTRSEAIIDKLIVLSAPATPSKPKNSEYQNFSDPRIGQISALIVSRHPLMTFEQLRATATLPTELERERAKGEAVTTYIVDLAVPFKRCIQDLSTGEHNLVVDGLYGCAMDAIALVGTVAGVVSKTVSIVSKASTLATRLGNLARLAIATGISIFNPLDDLPSVVRGTGKLVYKGGMRLSRQTQEIIALAKSQMGHIKGTQKSGQLLGTSDSAIVGQGTWRPKTASADTLTVLAARKDFHWYALDRTGKAWGPKLSNFMFDAPLRANRSHKTLPISYTRDVIKNSLPKVKAKIEQAIKAIGDHDFTRDRDFIIKAFLGSNTSDATDRILKYLNLIRTDFAGFSLSNLILEQYKDSGNIAAFNPEAYRQWIAASASERPDVMFMEVYARNLNAHFTGHGYNHAVVADDLIHEMLHGAAQTEDVSYASDTAKSGSADQTLNVTSLLNLASGNLPMDEEGTTTLYQSATKAVENADSLALVISLLDQYYTDKPEFERNLDTLEQCLAIHRTGAIVEPVVLTLNRSQ
ncbi:MULTISPECIES: hypothetical protein [Pseudomonas]|uniref:Dermonecrotic toxin n=1 Tax=Pseudomonas aphyarum TaxID=2942629 RepID=A0ABT5PPN6_9PSED|nr:hypothetical protein [Pseudomonas aphyarum]MDD0971266.1 hypothetical protein [Pseudomonas aphyarum]MDD1125768.1 hypothetical protein [Pseudomonas aphyarum]